MSAETKAAVDEALRAHVADEMPDFPLLTDYYVVCASAGGDADSTGYLHVSSDAASHVLIGLVQIGHRRLNAHFDNDGIE